MEIIVVAQFADDIFQPVMAAMPAALLELRHAGWQIEFIMRHQDLFWRDAIKGRHRRHGFPAQVHKGAAG